MRSYIRFDPEFADRKGHYPDGALSAFALTLCFAEHQPQRGFFKRAVLKALLERRARWIDYLVSHKDLEVLPDGRLYLVGWLEWQEGDWKVQERVQRIRARRTATVTSTVTSGVTETVNTPSEPLAVGGKRYAVSNHGEPLQPSGLTLRVLEWFMQRKGWQAIPGDRLGEQTACAERIATLQILESELLPAMETVWLTAKQKPVTLEYFWQPLQRFETETLKEQGRSTVRIDGLTAPDYAGYLARKTA